MRRPAVALTLVLAGVVGVAVGGVVHAQWPGPFSTSGGAVTRQVTPAPVTSSQPPTPTVRSSPTPVRSPAPTSGTTRPPRPSPTPQPSTTASHRPAPAFTRRALLQPPEFVDRGWAVARQVDAYDALPASAITPCTTIPAGTEGLVAGFAATYASNRTTAAELVARFGSTAQAERAFARLRVSIGGCVDAPKPFDRVRTTGFHHASPDRISELRWWNTRPRDDAPDRGVIGIVRVDDRVALVSLSSGERDPADTTDVKGLITQAGLRLV